MSARPFMCGGGGHLASLLSLFSWLLLRRRLRDVCAFSSSSCHPPLPLDPPHRLLCKRLLSFSCFLLLACCRHRGALLALVPTVSSSAGRWPSGSLSLPAPPSASSRAAASPALVGAFFSFTLCTPLRSRFRSACVPPGPLVVYRPFPVPAAATTQGPAALFSKPCVVRLPPFSPKLSTVPFIT